MTWICKHVLVVRRALSCTCACLSFSFPFLRQFHAADVLFALSSGLFPRHLLSIRHLRPCSTLPRVCCSVRCRDILQVRCSPVKDYKLCRLCSTMLCSSRVFLCIGTEARQFSAQPCMIWARVHDMQLKSPSSQPAFDFPSSSVAPIICAGRIIANFKQILSRATIAHAVN